MRDPYTILGVHKNADLTEIKAAWRAAAKALHPDQNPDDPHAASRFTELGRAYDILRDPEKRRRFDQARARAMGQSPSYASSAKPSTGTGPSSSASRTSAASGAKEKTFMEQRAERARKEAEARADAEERAAAAAAAVNATATGAAKDDATAAKRESAEDILAKMFGAGKQADEDRKPEAKPEPKPEPKAEAKPAPKPEPRAEAKPEPKPEVRPQTAYQEHDVEANEQPSPALGLISYVFKRLIRPAAPPERAPDLVMDAQVSIEDLLKRINPAVTLPDGKLLSLPLPEDAREGSVIRVEGYGHRLPGMKRGDVVATVRIKPHKWYRVDGHDLLTYVDIDIENAVLGCEATVTTPDGETKVEIPAWSGSQYKARLAGKGLPRGHGERGDLIAEVRVLLWDHPDQKVIDLMRSMKQGLYL